MTTIDLNEFETPNLTCVPDQSLVSGFGLNIKTNYLEVIVSAYQFQYDAKTHWIPKVGDWVEALDSVSLFRVARIERIRKHQVRDEYAFWVSYFGWPKKWDDWVPLNRLAPLGFSVIPLAKFQGVMSNIADFEPSIVIENPIHCFNFDKQTPSRKSYKWDMPWTLFTFQSNFEKFIKAWNMSTSPVNLGLMDPFFVTNIKELQNRLAQNMKSVEQEVTAVTAAVDLSNAIVKPEPTLELEIRNLTNPTNSTHYISNNISESKNTNCTTNEDNTASELVPQVSTIVGHIPTWQDLKDAKDPKNTELIVFVKHSILLVGDPKMFAQQFSAFVWKQSCHLIGSNLLRTEQSYDQDNKAGYVLRVEGLENAMKLVSFFHGMVFQTTVLFSGLFWPVAEFIEGDACKLETWQSCLGMNSSIQPYVLFPLFQNTQGI